MAASIRLQRAAQLGNILLRRKKVVIRAVDQKRFLQKNTIIGLRCPNVRPMSTQTAAASDSDSGAYHNIIRDSEKGKGESDKREFQAETRMLLDIVAKSLYSEKEVSRNLATLASNNVV
uniref:Uncharacterized protein n=1 Tax=Timema monikensis TaxID=170555 RepID=A0A7R9E6Q4_9NEOP|nr:unnamed protein product [Timema monikensis]